MTGHNAKLSDRSFQEKRDMKDGFADSPLYLNKMLSKLKEWNEIEINNRAKSLADIAVEVWSFPSVNLNNDLPINGLPIQYEYDKYLQGEIAELFEVIRQEIISLDISVREEHLKYYIAYKITKNFVDIYPQKKCLKLTLNMGFNEINDPLKLCKDISKYRYNGDIEVSFSSLSQLEEIMYLVRQAFQKYSNK